MSVGLLHRRLALLTGMSGILAFAAGAGAYAPMIIPCAAALLVGMFWQPSEATSAWFERAGIVLALLLTARAGLAVVTGGQDVVLPVVDLLFLLLAGEALRPLGHANDLRLYALAFALILAATAYHPGIVFAAGFVGFVIFGTLALSLGHVGREAERRGLRSPAVERGRVVRAIGLAGLVLLSSGIVFLVFPRASSGWIPRQVGREIEMAGFSSEVSLGSHGATIRPNPRIVLRATFPEGPPPLGVPLHWRGRAFVEFDGVTWRTGRSGTLLPSAEPARLVRSALAFVEQRIESEAVTDRVAFALSTPVFSRGVERTRISPRAENALQYRSGPSGPSYVVSSALGRPHPDSLRAAEPDEVVDASRYLQLPDLPERVAALADSLTAGLTNDYDRALAIESWLRSEFEYTLDLPATAAETGLDHFLFERRAGHCEYFSSSMAILLRTLGVPTREVSGFLGGRWNELGGFMAVTENEAHAWVEVWFPGWGWVTFDPTPPARTDLAAASAGWGWPALAFLDGLSYRWSSWILNFSGEDQVSFLERILWSSSERQAAAESGGASEELPIPFLRLSLIALLIVVWILFRTWRIRARQPFETRAFLRIRNAAVAAGIEGAARATPLALVELVAGVVPQARAATEAVVNAYLERRFSPRADHHPPDPIREAARQAVRELRRTRPVTDRSPLPATR